MLDNIYQLLSVKPFSVRIDLQLCRRAMTAWTAKGR